MKHVPDPTERPWRRYLGDGVYADYDGEYIRLTTEDGIRVTNQIAIEGAVWTSLRDYVSWLKKEAKRLREGG